MCGIAGFIDRSCPERASGRLTAMLDLIRHRGPDGVGRCERPELGVWMGMRRLSIIDLQTGRQPIWNEDETVAVVFNGEIYNYVELTRELTAAGHCFRTHSDTEVLVHLYEEHGTELLTKLRGMFAFALLDLRRRGLFLARDHFGQKPLYFVASHDRFAFASEIKSLLALPFVSREVDEDALLEYVSWLSIPAPRTHFRQIGKLPAGSSLWIDCDRPGHPVQRKYWSYDVAPRPRHASMSDAVAALDDALQHSVRDHLRADVPVGVLLSSGLDSRTVAAYARPLHPTRLATFSVGFADESSELAGAEQTARELQTDHFALELSAGDLRENIERVAWHLDEPAADPAAFAVYRVCELARQHVKVLLGGEGADELFGGYAARYQGIEQTISRSDLFRRFAPVLPRRQAFAATRWDRLCRRAHLSRTAELVGLRIEGLPGSVLTPRGLTSEQLTRLADRQRHLAERLCRPQPDVVGMAQALDIDWQLADSLLLKADKMSMAASIELRCPFLDLRVAEVARNLRRDLKLGRTGTGKLVLRACLARKLNEDPARPKKGFPVPLAAWLRGELREMVEETIFQPDAACLATLDGRQLRDAWEDLQAGAAHLAPAFYALWLYEVWRRVIHSVPVAA